MERERRITAGKRMTALVGKALEDDEVFWGHDTWNEEDQDGDDGNDSFRSSDEDSEMKRDEFDSDFDEPESDHDEEAEEERGRQREAVIRLEERKALSSSRQRKRSGRYAESAAVLLRKQPRGRKPRGGGGDDGLNAGIVLNLPLTATLTPSALAPPSATTRRTIAAAAPAASGEGHQRQVQLPAAQSIARTKARRATAKPRRAAAVAAAQQLQLALSSSSSLSSPRHASSASSLPQHSQSASTAPPPVTAASSPAGHKSKKPRRDAAGQTPAVISQAQMLLEAVHNTEPENERWLLARKRRMQDAESSSSARHESGPGGAAQSQSHIQNQHAKNATIVERFVSRRGYLNVISFPEMDHVPPILQASSKASHHQHHHPRGSRQSTAFASPVLCVITGKPARYRDPKTGCPYLDAIAFRELRRRHQAGEPLATAPRGANKEGGGGGCGAAQITAASTTGTVNGTNAPAAAAPEADATTADPSSSHGMMKSSSNEATPKALLSSTPSVPAVPFPSSSPRIHIHAPPNNASKQAATAPINGASNLKEPSMAPWPGSPCATAIIKQRSVAPVPSTTPAQESTIISNLKTPPSNGSTAGHDAMKPTIHVKIPRNPTEAKLAVLIPPPNKTDAVVSETPQTETAATVAAEMKPASFAVPPMPASSLYPQGSPLSLPPLHISRSRVPQISGVGAIATTTAKLSHVAPASPRHPPPSPSSSQVRASPRQRKPAAKALQGAQSS